MPANSLNVVFTGFRHSHRKFIWSSYANDLAKKLGYNIFHVPEGLDNPDDKFWAHFIKNADAIISTWEAPRLDHQILKANSRLRFVGHAGGSVAEVISPELFRRGVVVSTANQVMAETVAEWCLMMTLLAARRLCDCAQIGGLPLRWSVRDDLRSRERPSIGIWGYGDVARATIQMLKAVGFRQIMVCDPHFNEWEGNNHGLEKVSLEELMAGSEIIHLVQSLTPETRGRIGSRELGLVRSGATLINVGRAALVDRESLTRYLQKNKFTYITDVHYEEPPTGNTIFSTLPNVIATPHCASLVAEYQYAIYMLEEFQRLLNGDPLLYRVTCERVERMTMESLR